MKYISALLVGLFPRLVVLVPDLFSAIRELSTAKKSSCLVTTGMIHAGCFPKRLSYQNKQKEEKRKMDTQVLEELFSTYAAAVIAGVVVSIALFVFNLVCKWKLFTKAGEGGWKILIPIYNTYIHFKIANAKKRFWVCVVLTLAMSILSATFVGAIINYIQKYGSFPGVSTELALRMLAVAVISLVILIINITIHFSMAKAFGLPGIFGLGLWLLPVIFYAIIAFSGSIQHDSRKRYSRYLEE